MLVQIAPRAAAGGARGAAGGARAMTGGGLPAAAGAQAAAHAAASSGSVGLAVSVTGPRLVRADLPEGAVRLRPGSFGDVPPMADLINGYAAHGLMLPKSLGQLYRTLREFVIAEDADGRLLGCGALRIYDPGLAEICSLAVADAARGLGVGRKVVEALHREAIGFGLARVFALTLEPGFFHRLGYATVEKSVLPQKIEADCVGCPRRDACNEIAVIRTLSSESLEESQ